MVQRHWAADMPWSLSPRGSGAMTGRAPSGLIVSRNRSGASRLSSYGDIYAASMA